MQSDTVANGISISLAQRNGSHKNNVNASVGSTIVDIWYITGMLGYNNGAGNVLSCSHKSSKEEGGKKQKRNNPSQV